MITDEARKAMVTMSIINYLKAITMPCMNILIDRRNDSGTPIANLLRFRVKGLLVSDYDM